MDNNPNYFNQSYYQNIPNDEVNWAMLAQQWINQNQPRYERPPMNPWAQPPQNHYPPPHNYVGPPRAPYDPRYQPPPPRMSNVSSYGPPAPRMNFFNNYEDIPPRMPINNRPRLPSLMDLNIQHPPGSSVRAPPMYSAHPQPSQPQAPLFPSAQRTPASSAYHAMESQYDWPSNPPPPPPAPEWISSDVNNQDQPVLDTTEKKKLPDWIRQGLERMEKEKKIRQEKEEKRKILEKIEKEKVNNGRSRFDSDEEEEPRPKRKFEEYPDRSYMTAAEKEQIKVAVLRKIISSVLLQSTNSIIRKCCEDTVSRFRAKQSAKVVVNKATAALTALAQFGGDDSSEDETDNNNPSIISNSLSRGSSDYKDKEDKEIKRSRSRSPVNRRRSRSRSPRRHSDDRRRHSRDHDYKNHHRSRKSSNDYRQTGYHY